MTDGAIDRCAEGGTSQCGPQVARARAERGEAALSLSRQFTMSRRQAYRYIEEARLIGRPVPVVETATAVTFKLPPSLEVELLLNATGLGNNVFRCAVPGGFSDGSIDRGAGPGCRGPRRSELPNRSELKTLEEKPRLVRIKSSSAISTPKLSLGLTGAESSGAKRRD
jgi:hypothetical protein